jgi:tRNA pseudouridine55 synthase
VPLERLQQAPPPPLLNPLEPLAGLAQHRLEPEDLPGWRCGGAQQSRAALTAGSPVVVVSPDGNLAGMACALADGQLQPRLVLQAAG